MDDTISRQQAIKAIITSRFLVDAIEKITKLPTAQTDIIRCKDCEHYYKGNRCEMHEYLHFNEYDFCSYAERKEE